MDTISQPSRFYDSELVRSYELTEEMILEANETMKSDITIQDSWRQKYKQDLVRNWDRFYRRNEVNFFKDRNWTCKEFEELGTETPVNDIGFSPSSPSDCDSKPRHRRLIVEIGCGVGNALMPILKTHRDLDAICVDASSRAIEFLCARASSSGIKIDTQDGSSPVENDGSSPVENDGSSPVENDGSSPVENDGSSQVEKDGSSPVENDGLFRAAVWDITVGPLPASICVPESADFLLLLFVLSAIPPEFHSDVISRCAKALKPGGRLLFRDYGRYDMAQLRFAKTKKSKMGDNFYVRQDGTFAYYFLIDEIRKLFKDGGLEEVASSLVLREFKNRKTEISMRRVWIQASFRKI